MKTTEFSRAMNLLDDRYIMEALAYKKKRKGKAWIRWCSLAACAGVILALGISTYNNSNTAAKPNPEMVQLANPLVEVNSVSEMEKYLDFSVPVLEKDVQTYIVIVTEDYPTIGQIDYADGSEYRIQYGSGDISGIYGGELVNTEETDGVKISYYTYSGIDSEVAYALWEQDGYTFSYIYTGDGAGEIRTLIEKFKELH